jgi:cation transport regulator
MPYTSLSDLPDGVQHVLPQHGEEIYRAAYNNAWEQYADPAKRR